MAKSYISPEEGKELERLWEEHALAVREGAAAIPGSDTDSEKRARWIAAERKQSAAISRIREILG